MTTESRLPAPTPAQVRARARAWASAIPGGAVRRQALRRPGIRLEPPAARRWATWAAFALLLIAAPRLFTSSLSLALLSQTGIAIVACLSFNILLGQGGMLSFGHAVYSGLGAYAAMHALNAVSRGALACPVSLLPLVGGAAGGACALLLGHVATRQVGSGFAMITLGISELVFAVSLMFSGFFGGEAGVAGNRVAGRAFFGVTFGPQIEVYHLIAAYTFVCVAAMFAFTRTPLGGLLNAVRDNPRRVDFIGYDAQRVRWLAFGIAGFFAGVSGGLAALNFEIVTAEVVGTARSGAYLLFTVLGGTGFFFGPIVGAVLMVLAQLLLSTLTKAWLLYLGLAFVCMVMVAPGGLAGLLVLNLRVAVQGRLRDVGPAYLALCSAALLAAGGAAALIEMIYHLQLGAAGGAPLRFFGAALDARGADSWCGAVLLLLTGGGLFQVARRHFARDWAVLQAASEQQPSARALVRVAGAKRL